MARYQDVSLETASPDDEYRGFDVGEDDSARGPLILALAVGVMLVFGAVIWNTYRAGVRDTDGGVPSVMADTTPYKRKPADPGGVTVPDTDKRFYDQIDASERKPIETASLPTSPPTGELLLSGGPPADLRPQAPDLAEMPAAQNAVEPLVAESAPNAVTTVALSPASPPEALVDAPQPSAPQFAFSASGAYLVQVAAFRSEEAAEDSWRKAVAAQPGLYRGSAKHIQKADLGAKGVFYRLRIGAFEERSEAAAFCEALKASGSPCIVVNG